MGNGGAALLRLLDPSALSELFDRGTSDYRKKCLTSGLAFRSAYLR